MRSQVEARAAEKSESGKTSIEGDNTMRQKMGAQAHGGSKERVHRHMLKVRKVCTFTC